MRRFRALAVAAALALAGCAGAPVRQTGGPGDGTGEITVWFHAGGGAERTAFDDQVSRFNALGTGVTVRVVELPAGDYGRQLAAADRADRLPDLFDVAAPDLPAYVRDRTVVPLDGLVDPARVADVLDGVRGRGTVGGRLYGLGQTDAGVVLFANRARLAAAGVRPPAGLGDAWTAAAFGDVLTRLAATDPDGKVLDLRLSDGVEPGSEDRVTGWWATGFAPVIWSAGGDLLDRPRNTTASGFLDAPAVVDAIRQVAGWRDMVETDPRDLAFRTGTVALVWASSRAWLPYARALGRDLAVLPLPDFGAGVRTWQGSWTWAVSAGSARQRAAARFLDFLMTPAEVAVTAAASGAMPGTRTALAADKAYQPGGTMSLVADMLQAGCGSTAVAGRCVAVPPPVTAGWETVRNALGEALRAAFGGADPGPALSAAAARIDADFAKHDGYAP
ncbi:MAG TPA: extracellular solute-binding protein [Mycobacteriales bacterium]